jgi:hypothetical protein
MAHTISITDGTTTITLTPANGYRVEGYTPKAPESTLSGAVPLAQASRADLAETVAETIDLWPTAATTAAMQTKITELDRLLDTARRFQQTGIGTRVYWQLQPDGDAVTWRSELIDARLDSQEDLLKYWPNATVPMNLFILRRGFFEGALTAIPLTNANGSNSTAGLTVWNHDDAGTGHDNYVAIAAGDVTGSLPAPVVLELTNNAGATKQYQQFHIATNVFATPATLTPVIEAESTVVSGYGTTAADAACSNGNYVTKAGNGSWQMQFDLSATIMQKCAGNDFHIFARFRNAFTAYIRPSIYDSSAIVQLRRGDETQVTVLAQALTDLGVLPIPPGGYSAAWGAGRLVLDFRTDSSQTCELDYFLLMPALSFRRLTTIKTIADNGIVTDDPINDRAYATISSVEYPYVIRRGNPVKVWPNRAQRLYFAWSLADHSAAITETVSVKAWYRPRRVIV